MTSRRALLALSFVAAVAVSVAARGGGGEEKPFPCSPKGRAMAEKTPRDQPGEDRHARSGCGLTVASWARWTYDHKYKSYYVGGSQAPLHHTPRVCQHPRTLDEGTWGTDYAPWYSKVRLNWTHGQLYQDGGGHYEPDHKSFPFGLKFGPPRERRHAEEHGVEHPFAPEQPAQLGPPIRSLD